MPENTTIKAYDELINAVSVFQKRNLEMQLQLDRCSNTAIKAMNGDTTSEELADFIKKITSKMDEIDMKATALKKGLENTRDDLERV